MDFARVGGLLRSGSSLAQGGASDEWGMFHDINNNSGLPETN